MKKLSDYKGEEAIDLWADLMEPAANILSNEKVMKIMQSKKPPISIVHVILKECKKDAMNILTRIDDTPVNGLNAVTRLLTLVGEIMEDETMKGFFDMQGQKKEDASSGSDTANIEEKGISAVS